MPEATRSMRPAADTASGKIARFVESFCGERLTDAALRTVGHALVDTVAVGVAGTTEPAARIALAHAQESQACEMVTAWGSECTLTPESAAFSNGVTGHVLDFDDASEVVRGHVSIAMLPALLALGERDDCTGRDLAEAFVVGVEVFCKLGRAMVTQHYARGWHSTSAVGILAATAASARLLRLEPSQTTSALGLAVAQAAGTRANFGTMGKAFQAGHCNAAAVRAVLLAARGLEASADALDGPNGYMSLYAHGEDLDAQLDQLGAQQLELFAGGITIKRHPMCYAIQHAAEGVLALRTSHALSVEQIDQLEVVVPPKGLSALQQSHPVTGMEAKFSMQYVLAAALVDGRLDLGSFEDSAVDRPEIVALRPRISVKEADAGPPMPRWAQVNVRTKSGQTFASTVTRLKGSCDLPLSDDELLDKARGCYRAASRSIERCERFAAAALALNDHTVRQIMKRV